MITIRGKTVGRIKPLFEDWVLPFPPDLDEGGGRITLRDLIIKVVHEEVEAFRKRQENRRTLHALTAREIAEGSQKGKVDMGGRELAQEVDEESASAAALQAFEDGLYLVAVDGRQERELDHEVFLAPDSKVTFIRLVMIAGG